MCHRPDKNLFLLTSSPSQVSQDPSAVTGGPKEWKVLGDVLLLGQMRGTRGMDSATKLLVARLA